MMERWHWMILRCCRLLENNGIEEIKDIELTFHVYNADTYTTLFDSEVVSFTVE